MAGPLAGAGSPARGATIAARPGDCGGGLGPPVEARWLAAGGTAGALGCPVDREQASAASATSGAKAREARFADATIIWHVTGPHAGRTFLVGGCAYRLYVQYGRATGWLGLPIGEAVNTPDGKRQAFEGGTIRADRNGACEVEARAAARPIPGARSPIDLFHAEATGDDAVAATQGAAERLIAAGYRRVETLGYGLAGPAAGAAALAQFVDEATGAHLATATSEGRADAESKGFRFDGAQGYVLTDPAPGGLALRLYWSPATRHGLLATSAADQADAAARGYVFLRIEGYVFTTP